LAMTKLLSEYRYDRMALSTKGISLGEEFAGSHERIGERGYRGMREPTQRNQGNILGSSVDIYLL
jgi:hypothetical protein